MPYYEVITLKDLIIFVQMERNTNMEKTIHQGRNVKRFREMLGIKQEGLALELGDEWN
jgi:hypothetical protein